MGFRKSWSISESEEEKEEGKDRERGKDLKEVADETLKK